jgi:hypothetical protein
MVCIVSEPPVSWTCPLLVTLSGGTVLLSGRSHCISLRASLLRGDIRTIPTIGISRGSRLDENCGRRTHLRSWQNRQMWQATSWYGLRENGIKGYQSASQSWAHVAISACRPSGISDGYEAVAERTYDEAESKPFPIQSTVSMRSSSELRESLPSLDNVAGEVTTVLALSSYMLIASKLRLESCADRISGWVSRGPEKATHCGFRK